MNREEFLKDYNEPLMQAVEFIYKGKIYSAQGFWAVVAYADASDEDGEIISNGILRTKEEALYDKAFDGGTKALIDIIEEIEDVDFSF